MACWLARSADGLTLDLTVNTDFAQVESDAVEVNLDRFNLFYPEKRPFFLEGRKILSFEALGADQLFYSRRIGDITAGGKLLGKEGPWTFSALYSHGEPTGAEAPEGEDPTEGDYGVFRLQRDLGRSNIGVQGAGRSLEGLGQGSV